MTLGRDGHFAGPSFELRLEQSTSETTHTQVARFIEISLVFSAVDKLLFSYVC